MLKRLGSLYGVEVQDLLKRAGFLEDPDGIEARDDEPEEVERAYQYVLADPKFGWAPGPPAPCPWRPSGSLWRCTNASPENGCWNEYDRDAGRLL